MPPCRTVPSISEITAVSRGLRASNSSTTRGRPPVMSLVFVVSRGIFASTSPADAGSPLPTIKWAFDGMWYRCTICAVLADDLDRRLLLLVRRIDDDEPRQAGDLVEVLVDGHLVDDVLEADVPLLSVRIENVYGSHSTSIWPFSTCWPSRTLRCAP